MTTTGKKVFRQDYTCVLCGKHIRGVVGYAGESSYSSQMMHLRAKHEGALGGFLDTIYTRTGYTEEF